MPKGLVTIEKKFSTPEEELTFLRGEVLRKEQALAEKGTAPERGEVIKETVSAYASVPVQDAVAPHLEIPKTQQEAIILDLSPEPHDKQIEALVALLQKRGVRTAFDVVEKMNNVHIYDDFHRFLVQYIEAGLPVKGLPERSPLWRPLHMTLFEISLPEVSKEDGEKELKVLIAGMEQFYQGMLSVAERGTEDAYFTVEVANANGSDETIFYVSVPVSKKTLFEKQAKSLFHNSKIREVKDDYNIFNEQGISLGSVATLAKNPIFPLKLYDEFQVDPLSVLLHGFSKIDREGEGAAIQVVLRPPQHSYNERYEYALRQIQKGIPMRKAIDIPFSFAGQFLKGIKDVFSSEEEKLRKKLKEDKQGPKIDELAVEEIKKKVSAPALECVIRIVSSAGTREAAAEIIADLEAAFNQFKSGTGNELRFKRLEKAALGKLLRGFSLRQFDESAKLQLNVKEITTMMHFPSTKLKSAPALKQAKAGTAPAPASLPASGLLLGVNRVRGSDTKIYMTAEDRLRHFYTIGQTGTGKTTFLNNMIALDIVNGEGLCFIDPTAWIFWTCSP